MLITDLISPSRTLCCQEPVSKKRVLEQISLLLSEDAPSIDPGEIFDNLISRERLGSTGFGKGVAIPHSRVRLLERPVAAFLSVHGGVDFDSVDNQPVDLFFALLVPEQSSEDHLQLLSQIAQLFNDTKFVARLREVKTNRDLFEILRHWEPSSIPA